jgi:hypothetical protein
MKKTQWRNALPLHRPVVLRFRNMSFPYTQPRSYLVSISHTYHFTYRLVSKVYDDGKRRNAQVSAHAKSKNRQINLHSAYKVGQQHGLAQRGLKKLCNSEWLVFYGTSKLDKLSIVSIVNKF